MRQKIIKILLIVLLAISIICSVTLFIFWQSVKTDLNKVRDLYLKEQERPDNYKAIQTANQKMIDSLKLSNDVIDGDNKRLRNDNLLLMKQQTQIHQQFNNIYDKINQYNDSDINQLNILYDLLSKHRKTPLERN